MKYLVLHFVLALSGLLHRTPHPTVECNVASDGSRIETYAVNCPKGWMAELPGAPHTRERTPDELRDAVANATCRKMTADEAAADQPRDRNYTQVLVVIDQAWSEFDYLPADDNLPARVQI